MDNDMLISVATIGGMLFSVAVLLFQGAFNVKLAKVDRKVDKGLSDTAMELTVLNDKVDVLVDNHSVENQIRKIVKDVRDDWVCGTFDDPPMLKFLSECGEITIKFYNDMMIDDLKRNTEKTIENASKVALGAAISAASDFETDFKKIFWAKFEENAIEIRKEFLTIFEERITNGKHDMFVRAVLTYLKKQLNMVVRARIAYFGIDMTESMIKGKHKYKSF